MMVLLRRWPQLNRDDSCCIGERRLFLGAGRSFGVVVLVVVVAVEETQLWSPRTHMSRHSSYTKRGQQAEGLATNASSRLSSSAAVPTR